MNRKEETLRLSNAWTPVLIKTNVLRFNKKQIGGRGSFKKAGSEQPNDEGSDEVISNELVEGD